MYDTSLKRKWDNEAVLEYARHEAKAEGKAEGRAEGRVEGKAEGKAQGAEQKSYEIVSNLIDKFGFNDQQAASAVEVSLDFVKKVRASLKKK